MKGGNIPTRMSSTSMAYSTLASRDPLNFCLRFEERLLRAGHLLDSERREDFGFSSEGPSSKHRRRSTSSSSWDAPGPRFTRSTETRSSLSEKRGLMRSLQYRYCSG